LSVPLVHFQKLIDQLDEERLIRSQWNRPSVLCHQILIQPHAHIPRQHEVYFEGTLSTIET
jgi:hypothetical protein